jgi:hypothetical protein
MACFVLTWNPDVWEGMDDEDWDGFAERYDPDFRETTWSTGTRKSGIQKGDRLVFLRQGSHGRGIIALGVATTEIEERSHFNDPDKFARYVDVRWTSARTIEQRLPTELLIAMVPDVPWNNLQGSGVRVPDHSTDTLLRLWEQQGVEQLPTLFDCVLTRSRGLTHVASRDLDHMMRLLERAGDADLAYAFLDACAVQDYEIKVASTEISVFSEHKKFSAFYVNGTKKRRAIEFHFPETDERVALLASLFPMETIESGYRSFVLNSPLDVTRFIAAAHLIENGPLAATSGTPAYSTAPGLKGTALESPDQNLNEPARVTERRVETLTREGQDWFRRAQFRRWNRRCCITGIDHEAFLIASHIKPWHASSDRERLDPENGLLLSVAYDAAFDKGYITFSAKDGRLRASKLIEKGTLGRLGIDGSARLMGLSARNRDYLAFHNKEVFLDSTLISQT